MTVQIAIVESRDCSSDKRMIQIVGRRLREAGDSLNRESHNDRGWAWHVLVDFLSWCFGE